MAEPSPLPAWTTPTSRGWGAIDGVWSAIEAVLLNSVVGSGTVIGSSFVADALGSAVISSSSASEVASVNGSVTVCDVVVKAGLVCLVVLCAVVLLRSRSIKARLPSRSMACWLSLQCSVRALLPKTAIRPRAAKETCGQDKPAGV